MNEILNKIESLSKIVGNLILVNNVRPYIEKTGLDISMINLENNAYSVWYEIFKISNKEDKLDNILGFILEDFPNNSKIKEIKDWFIENNKFLSKAKITRVLVIGGLTGKSEFGDYEGQILTESGNLLGKSLAEANIDLLFCSSHKDSLDSYVVQGYSKISQRGNLIFHSPKHEEVEKSHVEFAKILKINYSELIPYWYPKYNTHEERKAAYLLCQLMALESADAVIAIGGKIDGSAIALLNFAIEKKKIIVPYTFLKGAAELAYNRLEWTNISEDIKEYLADDGGISKVVKIINSIKLSKFRISYDNLSNCKTFFISRAKEDSDFANDLSEALKTLNREAVFGDDVVGPDKMAIPSIYTAIQNSDVFIALWSRHYALSPWCYDELMDAIDFNEQISKKILLFNIDNSPVIPKKARALDIHKINDVEDLQITLKKILLSN